MCVTGEVTLIDKKPATQIRKPTTPCNSISPDPFPRGVLGEISSAHSKNGTPRKGEQLLGIEEDFQYSR